MSLRQRRQRWITLRWPVGQAMYQRQAWMACVPLLLLGVVGVAGLWELSHAEHTAALRWMQRYQSADGVGCCSEQDCVPWPVALLQTTEDEVDVVTSGGPS